MSGLQVIAMALLVSTAVPASGAADGHTGSSDLQDTQDLQGHPPSPALPDRLSLPDRSEPPWEWTFEKFVSWASSYEIAYEEGVDRPSIGWASPLWTFTRLVKSRLAEGVTADKAFAATDRIVQSAGGWQKMFSWLDGFSTEAAYAEFVTAWPKIRYRLQEDPLVQAYERAKRYRVRAPGREGKPPAPKYDEFISLVGWLQFTIGEPATNGAPTTDGKLRKAIYLPCRRIAELMQTTPRLVSIWRQWAIEAGILVITAPHKFRTQGRSEATEFVVADSYRRQFEAEMKRRIG